MAKIYYNVGNFIEYLTQKHKSPNSNQSLFAKQYFFASNKQSILGVLVDFNHFLKMPLKFLI
jgi:hypothetical protein